MPYGKKIRILYGKISHITGTDTYLAIDRKGMFPMPFFKVLAAVADALFYLNDAITTNVTISADTTKIWLPTELMFTFSAGTGGYIWLLYEVDDI